MTRTAPPSRQAFHFFQAIPTRWIDNDQYGHVNNVVYYAYFDTLISEFLIGIAGLDVDEGPVIGVCAESGCRYLKSVAHPATIDAGLRIARLGTSSVTYEIGIFRQGEDDPAAFGFFVHVFVERASMRPVPIPDRIRREMEKIAAG
ncbi:MAG: thioesterase family protein [Alphaproteobacteria bacterium]